MTPMTEQQLSEIEEMVKKATPGPYACDAPDGNYHDVVRVRKDDGGVIAVFIRQPSAAQRVLGIPDETTPNAELLAYAREAIITLLAEVRRLKELAGETE